jgi:hypothetical protein
MTPQQRQVLRYIYQDAKRFPHPMVSIIHDHLKQAGEELCEAGFIEHVASGYLLTKKGRAWCVDNRL